MNISGGEDLRHASVTSLLCLPTGTPSRHGAAERDRGRDRDPLQVEEEKEKGDEEEEDEQKEKRNSGLGILGHSPPLNLDTLPESHSKDCAELYKGNTTHITQAALLSWTPERSENGQECQTNSLQLNEWKTLVVAFDKNLKLDKKGKSFKPGCNNS